MCRGPSTALRSAQDDEIRGGWGRRQGKDRSFCIACALLGMTRFVEVWGLEDEFPVLADEVFAEAVVRLFGDEAVAFALVEVASGVEDAVGPEGDLAVAGVTGELCALTDERAAEA